jgi:hypothetical protein
MVMIRALLSSAVLLATSAALAAEPVPTLNVERSCRSVAAITEGKLTSEERCMSQERSARAELAEAWSQFDRADQKLCVSQTSLGGIPSYVELLACVQTARDARTLRSRAHAER